MFSQSHDPEPDVIKTPKKTSKTSSPFEAAVESNNSSDNQSSNDRLQQQLCNGTTTTDDGFRCVSNLYAPSPILSRCSLAHSTINAADILYVCV